MHYLTHINATIAAQVTTLIIPNLVDLAALSRFIVVSDKSTDEEVTGAFHSLQRLVFVGHTISILMNITTLTALIQPTNKKSKKSLQVSAVHFR